MMNLEELKQEIKRLEVEELKSEIESSRVEALKQELSERTGVPASMLRGKTAKENIDQARAFLDWKNDQEEKEAEPKTTREQFADWMRAREGVADEQPPEYAALAEIEERERVGAGGYPIVKDGSADNKYFGDPRTTREQFNDWLNKKTAYNPFTNRNGLI